MSDSQSPHSVKCSYCRLPLTTDKYSFSYGFPGIPRLYKCSRKYCELRSSFFGKIINFLKFLTECVQKLHCTPTIDVPRNFGKQLLEKILLK